MGNWTLYNPLKNAFGKAGIFPSVPETDRMKPTNTAVQRNRKISVQFRKDGQVINTIAYIPNDVTRIAEYVRKTYGRTARCTSK